MEAVTLVVYILPAVFAASIALIVVMLVLLAKQGDERRRAILDKACVSTFYITLGILAADAIRSAILVFIDGQECSGIPSFTLLALIAAVFAAALAVFKRKYGD